MKGNLKTNIVIIILALLIWVFFYIMSMPLSTVETAVVVGICAGVVYLGKWLWDRFIRKEKSNEQKP